MWNKVNTTWDQAMKQVGNPKEDYHKFHQFSCKVSCLFVFKYTVKMDLKINNVITKQQYSSCSLEEESGKESTSDTKSIIVKKNLHCWVEHSPENRLEPPWSWPALGRLRLGILQHGKGSTGVCHGESSHSDSLGVQFRKSVDNHILCS